MLVRCASLRPCFTATAIAGSAALRPLSARQGRHVVWHGEIVRCYTQVTSLPDRRTVQAPASRVREVETACAALVESIEAGDGPWFERLVSQLREVLAEQRVAVTCEPEMVNVSIVQEDLQGTFESKNLQSLHTTAKVESPSEVRPVPAAAAVPVKEARNAKRAASSVDEEPSWLRALRLLEKAAQTPPPRKEASSQQPRWSTNSDQTPQPGNISHEDDPGVAAYLASFDEPQFPEPPPERPRAAVDQGEEAEPAWVKTLRLLEAAAIPGGRASSSADTSVQTAEHEHAGEDATMDRYTQLLNARSSSNESSEEQAKRGTRMQRYAELLREADNIGKNTAPGGSVPPLRFPSSMPKQPASAVPPFPVGKSGPPKINTPLPPPPQTTSAAQRSKKKKRSPVDDPLSQAVGRGNLTTSIPGPSETDQRDEAVLRKEDFVWSEHEFNDGEKENKRVLRTFKAKFKKMAADTPDGLRDPKLLTAALDLALACVKCYELDKADAIYRRVIGECRRRGLPWDVKCIQDMATLRCKQHRQADAAELLEELANKAPPHPATFVNLGTVYNQLKMYEKAEVWFRQAVNLKGGTPERDDLWNIGIAKKNMRLFDEALPMLEQALAEFQEHEPDHPVTIAKLHSSVAGCLHDMGRPKPAIDEYEKAHALYVKTVGKGSPLFCSAAEGLAKALRDDRQHARAFEALLESFEVHARGDAVHPTPLFEGLELALELHDKEPEVPLYRFQVLIDAALDNMESRGLNEDGNAGLVMARSAKLLSRLGGSHTARASQLLHRGKSLIKLSHDVGEADLSHEIMEADFLLRRLEADVNASSGLEIPAALGTRALGSADLEAPRTSSVAT